DKKIHTFNISFGNEGNYIDESSLAKKVASKFNCNHHEVKINSTEFKNNFHDFIRSIDQPSGDGINSFLVSKFTAQHVSVALSGLGGDEVFLGYRYFQDLKNLQSFQASKIKRKFLPAMFKLYKNNKYFRSFAYKNKLDFLKFWPAQKDELYLNNRRLFNEAEKRGLLGNVLKNEIVRLVLPVRRSFGEGGSVVEGCERSNENKIQEIFKTELDELNAFSKAELSWYTPGMLLRDCDATSMFSTIEVRVPFLDHKLVEFLLTVPSEFKIYKNQKINKPLLANLFDDLLPSEILTYPKHGFEMPIGFWLKEEFGAELNDLKSVSWLNKNYVESLLDQFNQNPREYLKIWSLFVLKNWLQEYKI
ncbi:MAG: asparagine synthase C-terminal domain-containing protein, partial [bacterium]